MSPALALTLSIAASSAVAAPSHPVGAVVVSEPETERTPEATNESAPELAPDLGLVRIRDPATRRTLWLGTGVGGIYLPKSLTGLSRTVWTLRTPVAWSLALTPALAIGGRHTLIWYDVESARTRVNEQFVELSGRPTAGRGLAMRDRLSIGFEARDLKGTRTSDGTQFLIGGVRDIVVGIGYGAEHPIAARWSLGWQASARLAWVLADTQRQLRTSVRATVRPRRGHELWLGLVGHWVHRDPNPSRATPQFTAHGQVVADYSWMSRKHVGVFVHPRFATSALGGEAPLYEVRVSTLTTLYADAMVGVRAVWR